MCALGWGTAEMVMTKVLPLWVGARGVEFEWTNLQSALDSNLNLVSHYLHSIVSFDLKSMPYLHTHTLLVMLELWFYKRYCLIGICY